MQGDELTRYYASRAAEYEEVYSIPERQEEIALLKERLPQILGGHDVLELACGTGYWTQPIASQARSILATDIIKEVLRIAQAKDYPQENVRFIEADAFDLASVEGEFSAGFAGFLWSHIKLGALRPFLEGFHARIGPGRLIVFVDNTLTGTRHPFTRRDEEGNTYQTRRLNDGTEWEVLKNLPSELDLRTAVEGIGTDVKVEMMKYYWVLSYTTSG
jgi:demethylmenaquinone methyltransferase/2-methoxy-6-polyprenyl-1,4-benzoquinol methylase